MKTTMPLHGNLEHWSRQGVLLLNTCLTGELVVYLDLLQHVKEYHSEKWTTIFTSKQGVRMLMLLVAILNCFFRWEEFTDAVIRLLASRKENLVFLLWGKPAQAK